MREKSLKELFKKYSEFTRTMGALEKEKDLTYSKLTEIFQEDLDSFVQIFNVVCSIKNFLWSSSYSIVGDFFIIDSATSKNVKIKLIGGGEAYRMISEKKYNKIFQDTLKEKKIVQKIEALNKKYGIMFHFSIIM